MVVRAVFPSRKFIQDADFFLSRIQQQKEGKKWISCHSFFYIRKFYKIKNYLFFCTDICTENDLSQLTYN